MFKVWDTKYKEWVKDFVIEPNGQILVSDDYCGSCSQGKYATEEHELILVRTTGLQDLYGNSIDEGDIIRFCDCASDRTGGHMGDSIITGKVAYEYAMWLVKEHREDDGGFPLCDAHLNDDELEVIGSIYENPELLKGEED